MATTRYRSNTLADGGAFPVSLRALLHAGVQVKREQRSSEGRIVGGIVFDGGSFPQRLSHSLSRLRRRHKTASLVASPKPSAQGQARRWKRLDAVPTAALRNDRLQELNVIEA